MTLATEEGNTISVKATREFVGKVDVVVVAIVGHGVGVIRCVHQYVFGHYIVLRGVFESYAIDLVIGIGSYDIRGRQHNLCESHQRRYQNHRRSAGNSVEDSGEVLPPFRSTTDTFASSAPEAHTEHMRARMPVISIFFIGSCLVRMSFAKLLCVFFTFFGKFQKK